MIDKIDYEKKLVFATNNAHKLDEIRAILGDRVEVLSLKDIHCEADIPETADTLEGNAALKAEYIYKNYGLDCFADDTGLEVEALGGAPGVYSARYAGGEGHDSEANMKKLLVELEGKINRKAQFRTAICLIEGGTEHLFEGVVKGEIIEKNAVVQDLAMILFLSPKVILKHLPRWAMKKRIKSAIGQGQHRSFVII